jgi:hypothetical protein
MHMNLAWIVLPMRQAAAVKPVGVRELTMGSPARTFEIVKAPI